MDLSLKIDIVEDISTEDFKQNYFIPQNLCLSTVALSRKQKRTANGLLIFQKKWATLKLIFTITLLSNQKQRLLQVAI